MTRSLTIVDLFAGAGGFTAGASSAGAEVLWAANHWQAAVEVHALNHPDTLHACQDLTQANFYEVPDHDLLVASPACQGHARARGADRPHHDSQRSTAWAVIACVEAKLPANVLVENVPEFLNWKLYPVWKQALEVYGYHVTPYVFDSSEFGVAQERKRMFLLASRSSSMQLSSPRLPKIPIRSVLDLSQGRWSPVATKCEKTRDQVKRAKAKHGDTMLIVYNGARNAGRSLDAPAPTVTTVDRLAIVNKDEMRMLTLAEYCEVMGFSSDYRLARRKKDSIKLLGNAVCPPVASSLVSQIMEQAA